MPEGLESPLGNAATYRGLALERPVDTLWAAQEIICAGGADWIIDLGGAPNGAALFFADLLERIGAKGGVVTIGPQLCEHQILNDHPRYGVIPITATSAVAEHVCKSLDGSALVVVAPNVASRELIEICAPFLRTGDCLAASPQDLVGLEPTLKDHGLVACRRSDLLNVFIKPKPSVPLVLDRPDLTHLVHPRPFARGRVLVLGAAEDRDGFMVMASEVVVVRPEQESAIASLGRFDTAVIARLEQRGDARKISTIVAAAQDAAETLVVDVVLSDDGRPQLPEFENVPAVIELLNRSGRHVHVEGLGVHHLAGERRLMLRSTHTSNMPLHAFAPSMIAAIEQEAAAVQPKAVVSSDGCDSVIWRLPLDDGRHAALKMVESADPTKRLLAYREHRFLAALSHEGVPMLRGWGIDQGRYYLLTEWIDGIPLAGNEVKVAVALEDAARRVAFVDSLAGIHKALVAAGIEHRAINARNVMLRGHDPVLIDFANARWLDEKNAPVLVGEPLRDGEAIDALIAGLPG
jgi:serine/threonine protein kinase